MNTPLLQAAQPPGQHNLLLWSGLGVGAYGILSGRAGLVLLGFAAVTWAAFKERAQLAALSPLTPPPGYGVDLLTGKFTPLPAGSASLPMSLPTLRQ